jgi:hypothetical protein
MHKYVTVIYGKTDMSFVVYLETYIPIACSQDTIHNEFPQFLMSNVKTITKNLQKWPCYLKCSSELKTWGFHNQKSLKSGEFLLAW